MEIASVELYNVILNIAKELQGYYVNNVYAISPTSILIKLHHPIQPEKQLVISPDRGLWLTKYEFESASVGSFLKTSRTHLERVRFVQALQPAGERIAVLEFEGTNEIVKVIGEFFGGGNLVLTDKDSRIIACLRTIRVRHRRIVQGEKYALPPSRGIDFFHVKFEDIMRAKESSLEVARWLGREVSLSRKYVEEVLARAHVDKKANAKNLTNSDFISIYASCRKLADILSSNQLKGIIILDNSVPSDFAPPDMITLVGKTLIEKKSFVEAIDEVLSFDLKQELESSTNKDQLAKIQELDKSIQEQAKKREDAIAIAMKLRASANLIMQKWMNRVLRIGEMQNEFSAEPVKASLSMGKLLLKFGEDSMELKDGMSTMKITSRLFDEAKRLEAKSKLIEQAEAKLQEQKQIYLLQIQKKESKETFEMREEPSWFERYRWFSTSENLLAIGGRDAHSNAAIIRKHLANNDIVLHAEIVGSPFFIIKNAAQANMVSIEEAAKAVVSFSRAWREGIKVADAYWVNPEQVKLQAPTGMFLPKGSFLIEGKRNYIKSIKLEVAVGACNVEDRDTLMAGPISAIQRHCSAYVLITPENLKATDTAKKVKAEIIALLDEENAKIYKKIPLDDFVRVLPAGGGRVIGKGRGQKD
ncbi:MAG: fibronectin-binding domain-containing protein [Thaumarchaeota archaeon]|nr:fibronectin-binding domain-containing protein [Nitrososphaerota archaeon]